VFDNVWVSVPGLDDTLVDFTLKVFLLFLVDKGGAKNGPKPALGGEVDNARGGDGES
jgi:hypothetical protein